MESTLINVARHLYSGVSLDEAAEYVRTFVSVLTAETSNECLGD